ncbi:purine-nucleoside phosphorylase [Arsenophonus symbiont of Ornithomya chloropus]|uniref:purine-nucleoside phosphorylase n=1 Tax=Arsenophonus symbiont of Ornithomya chloropus TaxID=634121 RepID=UPI0032B1DD61
MSTPHIHASIGDFSNIVLMAGDPLRVQYIAKKFLSNAYQVNNIRSMLAFTGDYKGRIISVMGHGIGIPSCILYVQELVVDFGVKVILRTGSCGAIASDVKLRDIIVGMGACTDSKVNRLKFNDNDFAAIADYEMINNVVSVAKKKNTNIRVGNIFSTDLFYQTKIDFFHKIKKYGILGVEMEAAGLYGTAAEYGIKSLTICTVSDNIFTGEKIAAKERENTFNDMIEIALESLLLI